MASEESLHFSFAERDSTSHKGISTQVSSFIQKFKKCIQYPSTTVCTFANKTVISFCTYTD